ncbi:MAG: phenylalanine--tRNA ligase subunit beta, partial [Candidatus Nanoarchaeia archaeon]
MTILTLDKDKLEKNIGKIEQVREKIDMFGTPVEHIGNEVDIEIFPNRPDLLSMQGFVRSFLQYLGKKKPVKFKIHKPEKNYKVKVDKNLRDIRPYTACAVVKGLKLDDKKIKELVDIQEKLHQTLGRNRKKVAIGIYPLEKIKMPIRFVAKKPEEIKFIPLESDKEMTGKQILRQHPTGRAYAALLDGMDKYPVFIDAEEKILSMPPIINSKETGKITEKTREVFIECSGHNLVYLKKVLNIIAAALYDMGGRIYAMDVSGDENFTSPNLEPEKMGFKIEEINKQLGMNLKEKEIRICLEKMGIAIEKNKEQLYALIPAYRVDILHWIDLVEEVAIAYGYDNLQAELPDISTIGEESLGSRRKRTIGEILAGLGMLECSSYHLIPKSDLKKMGLENIEVENSKTDYSCLRKDLLTNLIKILAENSHASYPQKIFETGKVFEGLEEKDKLAGLVSY